MQQQLLKARKDVLHRPIRQERHSLTEKSQDRYVPLVLYHKVQFYGVLLSLFFIFPSPHNILVRIENTQYITSIKIPEMSFRLIQDVHKKERRFHVNKVCYRAICSP